MFQKIAKAGSRKCTSWHAELLGRNVAPLHLAREREMKVRERNGLGIRAVLHLAREREMKVPHPRRRQGRFALHLAREREMKENGHKANRLP